MGGGYDQVVFVWVVVAVVILAPIGYLWSAIGARRNFDRMIDPADDLKRADDGYRPTLGERDGTGGLV